MEPLPMQKEDGPIIELMAAIIAANLAIQAK